MTEKSASDSQHSNATMGGQAGRPGTQNAGAQGAQEGIQAVARELKGEVSHMAGDFAGEAKKAAESKLGAGKDFAAEHLGSVADALRKTGKELRSNQSAATEYVDKAASSVEMASHYLQTKTLSQLLGDVEQYARREPAVFLGGAFFAGMLGGRFLKAASPPRPAQAQGNAGRTGARSHAGHSPRALPARDGQSFSGQGPQYSAPSNRHEDSDGDAKRQSQGQQAPRGEDGASGAKPAASVSAGSAGGSQAQGAKKAAPGSASAASSTGTSGNGNGKNDDANRASKGSGAV